MTPRHARFTASLVCAFGLLSPSMPVRASGQDAAAQGGIVFMGSSIFHRWLDLTNQMAPLPVVNRGIDGTQTADMLRMVDGVISTHHPKVIAYYCGSNDVSAGEPAAAIFDRIRQFVQRVAAAQPGTRIVFVSINRAPEKRDRWDVVDAANRMVEGLAAQTRNLQYVDVNPVLFRDGAPRREFFMSDQLHLRPAAYEEFARVLKPVLTKALQAP